MEIGKSSYYIAEYLLLHSKESLTPLHINKLAFFSHGWSLGIFDRPLINETVEAWKYGPVIPSIFHTFKEYRSYVISLDAYFSNRDMKEIRDVNDEVFDKNDKSVMDKVLEVYGKFTGSQLIDITHEKDSPWDQYHDKDRLFVEIPNEVIQQYYKSKLEVIA